ncbi:hypothetical protein [Fluviicola taffensis]|uniref:DUF3899 domain-containing protein n=1 Tax=Fluviicola taffensis (strain DSM 16823 / NCIMB 13979 / RW262) TaxID=755732 RepID=F2IFT4_FLUTR|nr:hypothetical protein [Fluviicola taffensis]AEA42542.1 hypothetical protein Fluta_0537 [Fluviicola taffensis DSM 16823]
MEIEINTGQLIGILLMIVGLSLNTLIFAFSYYKIVAHLKELSDKKEEEEGETKKSFPVIRFIFRFRKILQEIQDSETKERYDLVISFLKWMLLVTTIMIFGGLILFLVGFFF